jgi:urease accessory protein
VVRPHVAAQHGSVSLIVLLLSGGLLDGDEVSIDAVVEKGARLQLRTQAATQVHAGQSRQTLRVTVAQDASFSYVPHALVPHAQADHHSATVVHLEAGGRALVAETLTPGRVLHGEEFIYRQVRLDLDAWCGNRLIARERALIRPDASLRRAQFGPSSYTASAYVLGGPELPPMSPCDTALIGTSPLARDGYLVRLLANRAADLEATLGRLHEHWWNERA